MRVRARLTSTREVDWGRFEPNFFAVFQPAAIEIAPQQFVLVTGFVNAVSGFTESPAVINGASELFGQLYGDAGKHARAAVSVNGLPLGVSVEVQLVLEVRD